MELGWIGLDYDFYDLHELLQDYRLHMTAVSH